MSTATTERRVPCGLCSELVPESHFRAGNARIVQGVLYCQNCSRAADTARVETVAFRQSLQIGGLYTCAKCNAPVPLQDIKSGAVIYFKGELSCRDCAKDLRLILGGRAPRPQQASGLGQAPRPSELRPSNASGPGPAPGQTGRLAPPPAGKCQLCGIAISQNQINDGRALIYEGEFYCPGCKGEVEELIQLSKESVEKLATFECISCKAKVPADDLVAEQAIRYQGQIYCVTCKAHFTQRAAATTQRLKRRVAPVTQAVPCAVCQRTISPLEIRLGEALELGGRLHCHRCKLDVEAAKKRLAAKAARAVTCALCSRAISTKELEAKRVGYHEGNVYCLRCAKHAGLVVAGAGSRSGFSSAELPAYGFPAPPVDSGERPALVVPPGDSGERPALAVPPGDSGERPALSPPPPGAAAPAFAHVSEFSMSSVSDEAAASASQELLKAVRSQPCGGDACPNVVTEADLLAGRAMVVGRRTLCATCANKVSGEVQIQRKAVRCSRCRGPLPAGAKPGGTCAQCLAASGEDEANTNAAAALSGEVALSCAKCQAFIPTSDLAGSKARTIDGKLYCRRCAGTAQAKPPSAYAKQCTTCGVPIKGTVHAFAGKPCCAECKVEFEKLLGKPPSQPRPCLACKKPSAGEGVLVIDGKTFCGTPSCKKQGEFLLLYTVRNRRTKRPIRIPPQVLGAAVGVVALGLGIYGFKTWRENRVPDAAVVVEKMPGQLEETPARKAIQEARRLANAPAPTYDLAQRNLVALARIGPDLAAEAAYAAEFKQLLAKATAARDAFAVKLAGDALADADAAARKDRLEDAVQLLGKFPEELLATPAGQDLTKARQRYAALGACRSRAVALLASKDPLRFEPMDGIAASPDARLCDFMATEVGKKLDRERRRLRNDYEARKASPTPTDRELAGDLEKAKRLEQANDFVGAEKVYRAVLAKDPDSIDAQIAIAQVAIERDRPAIARREIERAVTIAPGRTTTRVLEGWLAFLDRAPESFAKAKGALEGIGPRDLGRLGKRLKTLLDLGPPRRSGPRVRYHASSDVTDGEIEALPASLDDVAASLADALALPDGDDDVIVLLFKGVGPLATTAGRAETSTAADGRLKGSFSIALANANEEALLRAIGAALVNRADVPAWLVAGMPTLLAAGTQPPKPTGNATMEELENANVTAIASDPRLSSHAQALCAVFLHPTGPKAIRAYVTQRATDAAKARRELEAVAKKLGTR